MHAVVAAGGEREQVLEHPPLAVADQLVIAERRVVRQLREQRRVVI